MSEGDDILSRLQAQREALEAQIHEVNTAIAVVARTLGAAPPVPVDEGKRAEIRQSMASVMGGITPAMVRDIVPVPRDAFFRMSIADAAKKYLAMAKRKQSIQQIADALEAGGLSHTSKRFYGTVLTSLRRQEKQFGDIVKVGRGIWGLAEWYPNRKRKTAPVEAERLISLHPADAETDET